MLKKIQQDSHDKFEELGYPSKKLESWKFSPSKHLKKYDSNNLNQSNFSIEQYDNKYTLCFINGELAKESLNNFIYKDSITVSDIDELEDSSICSTSSNFEKEAFFHF